MLVALVPLNPKWAHSLPKNFSHETKEAHLRKKKEEVDTQILTRHMLVACVLLQSTLVGSVIGTNSWRDSSSKVYSLSDCSSLAYVSNNTSYFIYSAVYQSYALLTQPLNPAWWGQVLVTHRLAFPLSFHSLCLLLFRLFHSEAKPRDTENGK